MPNMAIGTEYTGNAATSLNHKQKSKIYVDIFILKNRKIIK